MKHDSLQPCKYTRRPWENSEEIFCFSRVRKLSAGVTKARQWILSWTNSVQ